MDKKDLLPFKVGQLAELRSFRLGFRGAWFQCKIKKISLRKGHIEHASEFFDFPDEKISWARVYQVPPTSRKSKERKKELMMRPPYPPIYRESQMPHANTISEVTVVINGEWNMGDLVDWWTDCCYWSGRVTQILGNDKVQIELPQPPVGEGSSYEVFCKDLRPSLNWSPENGWSVPTSEEGENCRCARLIKPVHQAHLLNSEIYAVDKGIIDVKVTAGSSFDTSFSSQISANSLSSMDKSNHCITKETPGQPLGIAIPKGATHRPEANADLDIRDSASSSHVRDASAEPAGRASGQDQYCCSQLSKKIRTGGNISLNSMRCDTLEAAILDLEELANRVKRLKGILGFGVPLSNSARTPWKFVELRASSTPE